MELNLETVNHRYHIDAYGQDGVTVLDHETQEKTTYAQSFIISPSKLIESWDADSPSTLTLETLAPLLALKPKILLLGSSESTLSFPPAEALAYCSQQTIGIETMILPSACRTFNLLAAEHRDVVAGIIQYTPIKPG